LFHGEKVVGDGGEGKGGSADRRGVFVPKVVCELKPSNPRGGNGSGMTDALMSVKKKKKKTNRKNKQPR